MATRMVRVRVRPVRVAVVVAAALGAEGFGQAVAFLSRLWGGRFGSILPAGGGHDDDTLAFLSRSRPEFVYGVGVDHGEWEHRAEAACQPRGYLPLPPESAKPIVHLPGHENFYSVEYALNELRRAPDLRPGRRTRVVTVAPEPGAPLAPYCDALFGRHYTKLRAEYRDEEVAFGAGSVAEFIHLATRFEREGCLSWLDATAMGLSLDVTGGGQFGRIAPTVVLVGNAVSDLALFWNLRAETDPDRPGDIFPLPADALSDPDVLDAVRDWVLTYRVPFGGPRSCGVVSHSVPEAECRAFAERVQEATGSAPHITAGYPASAAPAVVAHEYQVTQAIRSAGRRLTFLPPPPRLFEALGRDCTWMVDLLEDTRTGRAVGDVCLPPTPVAGELLHVPAAPAVRGSTHGEGIDQFGNGREGVAVRCTSRAEVVRLCLPSGAELVEETLRAAGFEPAFDEKRAAYRPVLRLLGGLGPAAAACAGVPGRVLGALAKGPSTLQKIKSTCKLGDGRLTDAAPAWPDAWIARHDEVTQRVTRRRFAERGPRGGPGGQTLTSLIEYWAGRGVAVRTWRVGPCPRCKRESDLPSIDLGGRVACPWCGGNLSLPERVPVAYALAPAVDHALAQGFGPVALTGRFLRNLTRHGFQWAPGVKYSRGGVAGDLDIAAVCDGRLVFAECKSLAGVGPDADCWGGVADQFLAAAEVARACGAGAAVLASLAESYPQSLLDRVAAVEGVACRLVARAELESGRLAADPGEMRVVEDWLA